jgi:EpsD family peptidyl-prolyl cis-trans isomerase
MLAALLGGCGSHGSSPAAATQVVARVNGREVTVSQLNLALTDTRAAELNAASTKRVLDELIEQELLVQAADSAKLDRDPLVVLRVDAARRQILARAYEERQVSASAPIEEAALHQFYDANPGLFKARRIYHIVEFATDQQQLPPPLLAELGRARTVQAQRELLGRYNVGFHTQEFARGPESMPIDLVPHLADASAGDVVITHSDGAPIKLLSLTAMDSSPISFEQASPAIGRFLQAQRNEQAIKTHLAQLQAAAKIEYVGTTGAAPNPAQVLQN